MKTRIELESKLYTTSSLFGFEPIRTPIFENLELFTAKSGQDVIGQLYAFEDKSGRKLTLRPELTAPVMRMIATTELREKTRPLKLCYSGPCFRYEETKSGRWREFDQFGVEIIGAKGPLVEAEVMACATQMLNSSGLNEWTLKIGHIGLLNEFLSFIKLPKQFDNDLRIIALNSGWTSEDHSSSKNDTPRNVLLRLLDKSEIDAAKDLLIIAGCGKDSEKLLQIISEANDISDLDNIKDTFGTLGINIEPIQNLQQSIIAMEKLGTPMKNIEINLTIARGLDYYTGCVFEGHVDALGGESQILGGGTYELLHLFGLKELDPSCGFGFGTDRVLLALQSQQNKNNQNGIRIAFLSIGIDTSMILPYVSILRNKGISSEVDLRQRKVGKAMKWAANNHFSHVILVGKKELETNLFTIKNLKTGEQVEMKLNEFINLVKK